MFKTMYLEMVLMWMFVSNFRYLNVWLKSNKTDKAKMKSELGGCMKNLGTDRFSPLIN